MRTDAEIESVIDAYSYNSTEVYTKAETDALIIHFTEYFTAGGANNDFICTHEPNGDSVNNVTVYVNGSLQPRPGTDYIYTAGTNTITVSGAVLDAGTIVILSYNY